MPATATIEDPEAIQDELSDLKERRDQLREKRKEVEAVLEKAQNRLREADSEEERNEALDDAHELQVRRDTLQEAEAEVRADMAELEQLLDEAKAAQREEERLESLVEKGREAIEAREEYDQLRDELLDVLREKAPELSERFSAWKNAATAFRDALKREERGVYQRPTSTSAEDEERAEALISELKDRGVTPFKDALDPHATGDARRWAGWSHDPGYSGPGGHLQNAIESVRAVGRDEN